MTNFDALKQIYEALGGADSISGSNLDALKAIASVASGGGGGGGGVFITTSNWDETTGATLLDKTWKEIHDAALAGSIVYWKDGNVTGDRYCSLMQIENTPLSGYRVLFNSPGGETIYIAQEADGYPALEVWGEGGI